MRRLADGEYVRLRFGGHRWTVVVHRPPVDAPVVELMFEERYHVVAIEVDNALTLGDRWLRTEARRQLLNFDPEHARVNVTSYLRKLLDRFLHVARVEAVLWGGP